MDKVIGLKKVDNQWFWGFKGDKNAYYTNSSGEGIFKQKSIRETNWANECDEKQITGTCQFSLSGYTLSGARKKLNRCFDN